MPEKDIDKLSQLVDNHYNVPPASQPQPPDIFSTLKDALQTPMVQPDGQQTTTPRPQATIPTVRVGFAPKVAPVVQGEIVPKSARARAWEKVKQHKIQVIAGTLAVAAVVGYGLQSGLLADARDSLSTATAGVTGADNHENFYDIQKPACILETAFTAKVEGTASLLVQLSVIDSPTLNPKPEVAKAVVAARTKAYADKKYIAPKELTKTVPPSAKNTNDDIYIMSLPQIPDFVKQANGQATTQNSAEPKTNYVKRLPQAGYFAKNMEFNICLTEESSMSQEVVEQLSPRHLVVHMDKFTVGAESKQRADYETNPPQVPDYPPSVPVAERQSLFTHSEINRVYKFLAPAGKYDPKTKENVSGDVRNPVIQEATKLLTLQEISKGKNWVTLQKDAESSLREDIQEDVASQLEAVNKKNGTNFSVKDVVIDFEGAPINPAVPYAKSRTETEGNVALKDPQVTYESTRKSPVAS